MGGPGKCNASCLFSYFAKICSAVILRGVYLANKRKNYSNYISIIFFFVYTGNKLLIPNLYIIAKSVIYFQMIDYWVTVGFVSNQCFVISTQTRKLNRIIIE